MKWISVVAFACLATPAIAVNIETDAGILIGQACSEIWDAKDDRHLDGLTGIILDRYSLLYADIADTSTAAKNAYEVARMNYVTAYNALTDSLQSLATKAGDLALKAALEPRLKSPDSSVLDGLVEAAVAAGDTVVKGTNVAVTDAANTELVAAQLAAEKELLRAGKAHLHEEAREAALDLVLDAIFVCITDQKNYLKGGPPPKKE